MKEPPPSARVTELRAALKALVSAMEAAVRETAVDPNASASDASREVTVDEHFATMALLLRVREPERRDPEAHPEAHDAEPHHGETPQGEKAIATMAAVHARLERTFRLYMRAAAAGKHLARKEMRRVLSEVKAHAPEWQ